MRLRVIVVVLSALSLGYVAVAVRLPYLAIEPGRAIDVLPRIQVEGSGDDGPGSILSTDVVLRQLAPLDLVVAWLDPDVDVIPEELFVREDGTFEEEARSAREQMASSKVTAAAAALRVVSGYPGTRGRGALVEAVTSGCDADGKIRPGDVILAIDGDPVRSNRDAGEQLAAIPSGSSVTLRVDGDGGGGIADVAVIREPCGGSAEPLVGVSLMPNFPVPVTIASGEVGGPSAGLAFALGVFDLLTPGDLTGGRVVAVTGAILARGRVLPVGGIPQKMRAAEAAGATVFLVPRGNLRIALTVDTDMVVLPVGSLAEALAALDGQPVG